MTLTRVTFSGYNSAITCVGCGDTFGGMNSEDIGYRCDDCDDFFCQWCTDPTATHCPNCNPIDSECEVCGGMGEIERDCDLIDEIYYPRDISPCPECNIK